MLKTEKKKKKKKTKLFFFSSGKRFFLSWTIPIANETIVFFFLSFAPFTRSFTFTARLEPQFYRMQQLTSEGPKVERMTDSLTD